MTEELFPLIDFVVKTVVTEQVPSTQIVAIVAFHLLNDITLPLLVYLVVESIVTE